MYYVSLWSLVTTFLMLFCIFVNKPVTGVKKYHSGMFVLELYSKETSNHQSPLSGDFFFVVIHPISFLLLPPIPVTPVFYINMYVFNDT